VHEAQVGPFWRVLLLGGNSGTGKTTAARALGLRFGVSWAQADDFRLALQRLTTRASYPTLHVFEAEHVWQLPAEQLCDRLITTAGVVSEALRVVIAHHVLTPHPLILEGDGLVPAMAQHHIQVDPETRGHVRAVFLHEKNETILLTGMRARGRGFQRYSASEQGNQVRAARLYGEWLRREAEQYGLPTLPARPYETLVERILSNIECP